MIDTHCHLGHVEAPLETAIGGLDWVVDVGMGAAEAAQVVARAEGSGGRVRAAVGIHPNDLGEFVADPDGAVAVIERFASAPLVVAIGETGLDNYRERSGHEDQERAFRAHIALAKRAGLTLVIHCRDAHARVLEVLDAEGPPDRVVMHCFSGDEGYAGECARRGFFCSFAGNLTYKANDALRRAAVSLPDELLLVETDAPYLAPVPHRGRPNLPAYVALTAACLAELRSADLHDILVRNAERAFELRT